MAPDSTKPEASAELSAYSCKLLAKSSLDGAWAAASLACCAVASAASAQEAFSFAALMLIMMFWFPVPLSLRSGIHVQYSHVNPELTYGVYRNLEFL